VTAPPRADKFRLDGRVIVVTGSSSGLGLAIAVACAQAGAATVLGARRADLLAKAAAMISAEGGQCAYRSTDVTRPADCDVLAAYAVERFGRVDGLVNNAGVGSAAPGTREAPEAFRAVIEVNLMGAYWMAQSFGRSATSGGAIVNVASVTAVAPGGIPQAAYASSKAGLLGLTRDLAAQWGARKAIRVNAVLPGLFDTEMRQAMDETEVALRLGATRLARIGRPAELAAAVQFLLSDAASYITGATLAVDGGITMH
jgi:NAD(P)-dependent dehydrogenase (short-subunit alcohol dehydrogenase family)